MAASCSSFIPTPLAHADNQGEGHPRGAPFHMYKHYKKIVTSVQEESDPVDDETDEDEDNNESNKCSSKADAFSALETAME
ncbi:hypothetical protein TNCV_4536341 [Trichonephila clavipes]|nr:hypothetical protein TNCV_4536341 [Trichonephila clavipes]